MVRCEIDAGDSMVINPIYPTDNCTESSIAVSMLAATVDNGQNAWQHFSCEVLLAVARQFRPPLPMHSASTVIAKVSCNLPVFRSFNRLAVNGYGLDC